MASKENMAQRPVLEMEQNQIKSCEGEENSQIPDSALKSQIHRTKAGNLVRKAWTSFNLTICKNGQQSPLLDFTTSLQPIKMQYLLKYHKDTVNKHLNDTKYRIRTKDAGIAVIEVVSSTNQQHDEILGEVVAILDEMAKTVIKKTYPILKSDVRLIVFEEFGNRFKDKDTNVAIYDDGKSSLVLVGQNESLEPAFELLKQIIDDKQKRTRSIAIDTKLKANLIHNLDFKTVLKSKTDVKFSIDFKGQMITFENSSKDDIEKYMQIMQKFLISITVMEWMCPETFLKLLQMVKVREYIQDWLLHRGIQCLLDFKQNSLVIYCSSLSSTDGEYVIALVKTSIQTIRVDKRLSLSCEVRDVLDKFNNKCISNIIDHGIVEVTATNDAALEIMITMAQLDDRKESKLTSSQNSQHSEPQTEGPCCICMDTITYPKKLQCGHVFCTECFDQVFKYKPSCPQCGKIFGKVTGDQPPGTIEVRKKQWVHLPGYEKHGTIEVSYNIPSGRQTAEHPKPGTSYEGIYRSGYLPDNKKGNLVAKLLRIAFDRRLIFTIGHSRTTGAEGVVTWNGIHHKTRMEGGPQRFGYPDDTYLDRVLDELAVKGVTEEPLNDP